MIDKSSSVDILWELGPGGRSFPCEIKQRRNELDHEAQKYVHVMGPTPKRCLETLADLGLSDPEIARYFKIPAEIVTDLRRIWNIHGEI